MVVCICLLLIVVGYILLNPSILHKFTLKPYKKHNGEKSQEKLPSNFSLIRKYIKKIYNNEFEVRQNDWPSSHGYWEFYKIPIKNGVYIQIQLERICSLSTVSGSNKLVDKYLLEKMDVYLVTEDNTTQELFSTEFLTENSIEYIVHHIRKPYKFIIHMEKRRKEIEEEIKLKAEKEAEDKRKEQENKIRKVLSCI